MVLLPQKEGWWVRLKTGKEVVELPLSALELRDAVVEAEQLYADARTIASGTPTCQQCVHWEFVSGECSLEFVEGGAATVSMRGLRGVLDKLSAAPLGRVAAVALVRCGAV